MTGLTRRAPSLRWTIRGRLAALVAMLVVVISGIIVLSAGSASDQRSRALVDNIAGRQPVLVQRYLKEVLLVSDGFRADPTETEQQLIATGDALVDGGRVLAVQGNDHQVTIGGATDETVRVKLIEENRLAHQLTDLGERIVAERPSSPTFRADVNQAVELSNLTANVGHDAVGRMSLVAEKAVAANSRSQIGLAVAGILLALMFAWTLTRQIVRRLRGVSAVVVARANGDSTARYAVTGHDEITVLSDALNHQADYLDGVQSRLAANAERDSFAKRLVEAFEMAEEEPDAYQVVERSMTVIAAQSPMELLLADSSRAHLQTVAISPSAGAAGCGVESPYSCVAVRRANPVIFPSSDALNACPRLLDRPGGACSAVCVPVSFMGKALGVLHVTGPNQAHPDNDQIVQLTALAGQAGARIGTLRAFQQSQLQASTDGLTGLINRRTLENSAHSLLQQRKPFALAMADLDHFKALNDTYGHDAGDRALRLFAETVKSAVRSDDLVCRYGGEEFVLLFPDTACEQASELLDRVRVILAAAVASGETPAFTATFGVTDTNAGSTLEDLLRVADKAMYKGKQAGRNQVAIASTTNDLPAESEQPR